MGMWLGQTGRVRSNMGCPTEKRCMGRWLIVGYGRRCGQVRSNHFNRNDSPQNQPAKKNAVIPRGDLLWPERKPVLPHGNDISIDWGTNQGKPIGVATRAAQQTSKDRQRRMAWNGGQRPTPNNLDGKDNIARAFVWLPSTLRLDQLHEDRDGLTTHLEQRLTHGCHA
jgi:hypothetical protein